ncbi:MAG: AbgT family transporter, partial [Anaerolineales bacterium]|nr:AbgT family transporter [Anaerolineales bacterium]
MSKETEHDTTETKRGFTQRLLDGIETVGNKVPHPVLMFLYLIIGVIILSHILWWAGVSVTEQIAVPVAVPAEREYYEDTTQPGIVVPPDGYTTDYEIQERTIAIQSLLTVEGIRFLFSSFVGNFQGFGVVAV